MRSDLQVYSQADCFYALWFIFCNDILYLLPVPVATRMFVCCECCVLSGRGLCDELITRPESLTDCGALLCVI